MVLYKEIKSCKSYSFFLVFVGNSASDRRTPIFVLFLWKRCLWAAKCQRFQCNPPPFVTHPLLETPRAQKKKNYLERDLEACRHLAFCCISWYYELLGDQITDPGQETIDLFRLVQGSKFVREGATDVQNKVSTTSGAVSWRCSQHTAALAN